MTRVGMLHFGPDALVRKHHRQRIGMAKKKGNAGSSKAAAKAKRSSAKAQKTRAAKDAAAVKAVLDAEAVREAEVDENEPTDLLCAAVLLY
jgi:hypothetical protein